MKPLIKRCERVEVCTVCSCNYIGSVISGTLRDLHNLDQASVTM